MTFDVLKIADLRFPGGTSSAIAHEIRALAGAGYRVGLLPKRARTLKRKRPINPQIQTLIDQGLAVLIEPRATTSVAARLAVIHNPYVLEDIEPGLPRIACEQGVLVGHQPVTDGNGVPYYDVDLIRRHAAELLGQEPPWAPISPLSRANMTQNVDLPVTADDWTNLIFVDDWVVDRSRPIGARPVVGRHSRPDWPKWPASRAEMLAIYPDHPDVAVRLLGVGEGLEALMQGAYPDNWERLGFNEIGVHEFLGGIDFFVYFHHPDWTEGFGRTIAEAAASGLAPILPHHFEATFGARGAIYCAPHEVRDLVSELHADWDGYRLLGELARREVDKRYGPARYLARVERLIGSAGGATKVAMPGGRIEPVAAEMPAGPARSAFDVVHVGDFRGCREAAWRVVNLVRIEHELGHATGLLQVMTDQVTDLPVINPEIDQLVADGCAVPIAPDLSEVTAKIAFVHQPGALFDRLASGGELHLPGMRFERCVVIHDRRLSGVQLRARDAQLRALLGPIPITWVATDVERKAEIEAADLTQGRGGATTEVELFRPAIACAPWRERRVWRSRPVIGRASLGDSSQWPDLPHASLPSDGSCVVRVLGLPTAGRAPNIDRLERFALREANGFKFIRGLDAFLYFPGERPSELPVHAVLTALCHGVPAYVDGRFKSAFGKGPRYLAANAAVAEVRKVFATPDVYAREAAETARQARQAYGPQIHAQRLQRWIGATRPETVPGRMALEATAGSRRNGSARDRVLFMSSNGVGLGHLTRLLAIARRMPASVEPVFVTMSQGLEVVRQCGYPVEYLPFHAYANCDPRAWSAWFADHFGQILDFHGARAVVFDGGQPYQGLIDAMAHRRDVELVWVRRGMWREAQDNRVALERQRLFDLVIEPAEIADSMDRGGTASADGRAVAVAVAPIRLLDESELLSREDAAAHIGIDPARPSCLIQLGSGSNRDIVSMIDTVLAQLGTIDGMQPVLAEWLIGQHDLDFWPGIPRLRGFPLSLYFNAFDFTISAAGYNSFNEIVSFGLPAIFMGNQHATMDDQHGRATFAQANDAAFALPDHRPDAIGPMLDAILDPGRRDLMRANCARISLDNGAQAAAGAVAALI